MIWLSSILRKIDGYFRALKQKEMWDAFLSDIMVFSSHAKPDTSQREL
jgi:hypothetical protein